MRESVQGLARSRAGRDGPFVLFFLGLLGGSAWFAYRLLSGLDFLELLHLIPDDAYYYSQIARNMAAGQFSTFDGGITLTNGYHPAWLFLITPLYWVFDAKEALVAIKGLEIGLLAGGVALVAVAARLARLPWILLAFVPLALSQHGGLIAGMEAAARVFAYGLMFAFLGGYARNAERWKWPLAGLAFALPWVRLEDLAVSVAVTGTLFLLEIRRFRGEGGGGELQERGASWTSLPALGPLLATAASLPVYCAYNSLVFGGPVPVSGAVKWVLSQRRWVRDGGYDLVRSFQETAAFEAFDSELLAALEICAYLLILLWIGRSRGDWFSTVFLVGAFGLAIGHLATFWNFVFNLHFAELVWPWYFASARLMMAILVPIRCYMGICFIRKFVMTKQPGMAEGLVFGVILLGLGVQLLDSGSGGTVAKRAPKNPLKVVDRLNERDHRHTNLIHFFDVQIMNRILPSGSVVGSWNAGLTGYYSKFPVVNLDGIVNSYSFLDELKSINFGYLYIKQQFNPYYYSKIFSKYGITHFADIELPIGLEKSLKKHATLLFEGEVSDETVSLKVFSMTPRYMSDNMTGKSDYFFEKMKPYWIYESRRTSVVRLSRRGLRAFAKDCYLGALEDDWFEIQWTEENSESMSALWQPWKAAKTNSLEFCESTYILPKNAVEPIRVQAVPRDTASLLN